MEYEFCGTHLIAEGYFLNYDDLNNINLFLELLNKGIHKANVTNCGTLIKKFEPTGITIVILLSESHISIHTYPEKQALFLDIFTCGTKNPKIIFNEIKNYFSKKKKKGAKFDIKIFKRGKKN